LKKQQEIDRLREENARLKGRLRYQERTAKEGIFGSSTPSSKIPVKPNSPGEQTPRFGGAKPGHVGHGRHTVEPGNADRVERVLAPEHCPECGRPLETKGTKARTVIDVQPLRRQTVCYQLDQKYCPHCHKLVRASAPGVLPRALLGNRLLAPVAVQHYVHGVTLGQLESQLDVGYGTLIGALHQLARLLARAIQLRGLELTAQQFRQQAAQTQQQILALAQAPAQHPGIQKIQNIFREQTKRLFRWASSPNIPADNNRAERELRPLVIARKVSFGSQSEAGARTRETLMTVLHTLRKRSPNMTAAFEQALNRLAEEQTDPYTALGFDSS
jgi:hypothetical protein